MSGGEQVWRAHHGRGGALAVGTLFAVVGMGLMAWGPTSSHLGFGVLLAAFGSFIAIVKGWLRPMSLVFDDEGVQVVEWMTTRWRWDEVTALRFRVSRLQKSPVLMTELEVDGHWVGYAIGGFSEPEQDEIRAAFEARLRKATPSSSRS